MARLRAIASYFNPMRYRRRLQNYLAFRRRLTVPLRMETAWAQRYEAWAARLLERVRGNIDCTDGTIAHLWHGELRHRCHQGRHAPFAAFGYDPAVDSALAGSHA